MTIDQRRKWCSLVCGILFIGVGIGVICFYDSNSVDYSQQMLFRINTVACTLLIIGVLFIIFFLVQWYYDRYGYTRIGP